MNSGNELLIRCRLDNLTCYEAKGLYVLIKTFGHLYDFEPVFHKKVFDIICDGHTLFSILCQLGLLVHTSHIPESAIAQLLRSTNDYLSIVGNISGYYFSLMKRAKNSDCLVEKRVNNSGHQ